MDGNVIVRRGVEKEGHSFQNPWDVFPWPEFGVCHLAQKQDVITRTI